MTMPDRIWASKDDIFDRYLDHQSDDCQAWVRADIAADLARALDMAQVWLNYEGRYDIQGINAALARYNAAVGK